MSTHGISAPDVPKADRYLVTGPRVPFIFHGTTSGLYEAMAYARDASKKVRLLCVLWGVFGTQREQIQIWQAGTLAWSYGREDLPGGR